MPDKAMISHRGEKYEIGRGKRFYGIWKIGAPYDAPVDRWPETRDGWQQAWTRFAAIETPGTIEALQRERTGFWLRFGSNGIGGGSAGAGRGAGADGPVTDDVTATAGNKPGGALLAAEGLLVLGVVLGLAGLFPGYVGGQSLLSQSDQVVPHLLYVIGWAVSAGLIALSVARPGMARLGALLGLGLSVVTFGLFLSDLGEAISGNLALGNGLVLSLISWGLCMAGSGLAFAIARDDSVTDTAPGATIPPAAETGPGRPALAQPGFAQPGLAQPGSAQPGLAQPGSAQPGWAQPGYAQPGFAQPGYAQPGYSYAQPGSAPSAAESQRGLFGLSWLRRPTRADAGPVALLVLAGIGTAAAFAPSWDSYTLASTVEGTAQTYTEGNAFANPGIMIAGNVAVMVAVILVAALAALWRPPRQGALLLAGAVIPMAGQAVSALLQISQPTSPSLFGLTQAQASSLGLTISSGVTSIFWVYCVFVISLLISCAWLMTAPARPAMPPMQSMPFGGWLPPSGGDDAAPTSDDADGTAEPDSELADTDDPDAADDDSDDGDSGSGAEDDEQSAYAG